LTMSAEDAQKLTDDITKAKTVFEAAIASVTGLKADQVNVTKIIYGDDGEGKLRRLAGATESVVNVEFLIESDKPPATDFKASDLKEAIEKEAKAEGIDGIEVTVTKSTIAQVSSPPAPAGDDEDSSSVAIVLTVLSVCLVIFGMIGGFIYWYRAELKTWYSMKAGQASESAKGNIV